MANGIVTVWVKTLVTDVNIPFLGFLGLLDPTIGTIGKAGAEGVHVV